MTRSEPKGRRKASRLKAKLLMHGVGEDDCRGDIVLK